MRFLIVCTLLWSSVAAANVLEDPAVSLEIGGAPTVLFSDTKTQAFGLGFGYQFGLAVSTMNKKQLGGKLRVDRYYSRQEATSKTDTSVIEDQTYLKSLSQQYLLIGAGIEWRTKDPGHMFFYEALVGYALGARGIAEVTARSGESEIHSYDVPVLSLPYLMGGAGIKRAWLEKINLIASARTFLLIGTPYDNQLKNKILVPVPVMLSVGAEYRF